MLAHRLYRVVSRVLVYDGVCCYLDRDRNTSILLRRRHVTIVSFCEEELQDNVGALDLVALAGISRAGHQRCDRLDVGSPQERDI